MRGQSSVCALSTAATYSNLKSGSKSLIKDYSRISTGIVSIALLFSIIIAISPLASAQTPTQTTVNYDVDDSLFGNPERGFYKFSETHSNGYNPLNANTVTNWRTNYVDETTGPNPITVVARNFYLENFLDDSVSDSYLQKMQDDFDALRDGGAKFKLKFSYFKTCAYPEYADLSPDPSRVFQHIQDLKDVINANADVIMTVQLGFVGAWGEWWADDEFGPFPGNGSCEGTSADGITEQNWIDRRRVVNDMLEALVDDRTVSIRNVKWKMGVFERDTPISDVEGYSGTAVARAGHYNDCFLANPTNKGTWSSNYDTREAQKDFVSQETKYLPMGGETCGD